MNERIVQALEKHFEGNRYVFWRDVKGDLRNDFHEFRDSHPNIVCEEVNRNELGLKYRVLRSESEKKFLLYRAGEVSPEDNWLLDLELSTVVFSADKVDIWRDDIGINPAFRSIVENHQDFFTVQKRRDALKSKITTTEQTERTILQAMISVCAGAATDFSSVIYELLHEVAQEKTDRFDLIKKCSLTEAFWEWVRLETAYRASGPTLTDFLFELFKTCCDGIGFEGTLNQNAQILMSHWMDSAKYSSDFVALSKDVSDKLNARDKFASEDLNSLRSIHSFSAIDKQIIVQLFDAVEDRTLSLSDVEGIVAERRDNIWCKDDSRLRNLYDTILYASRLLAELDKVQLVANDITDAFRKYSKSWYRVDQLYRKVIYFASQTSAMGSLDEFVGKIENDYLDRFLRPLSARFQTYVDQRTSWYVPAVTLQKDFFKTIVSERYLQRGVKVAVIISDALRYEVAEELRSHIAGMDRFETSIEPMLGVLPSYTQLGMAALLPNKTLDLNGDGNFVKVDGTVIRGLEGRSDTLIRNCPDSICFKYEVLNKMAVTELRSVVREHQLIYVYHNELDSTGEEGEAQGAVFKAAEDTFSQLKELVRKLTSANITHILVTSDHGFLYRHGALEPMDFTEDKPLGQSINKLDRRFVIGKGLIGTATLNKFTSEQLNLSGSEEILIPKCAVRIRRSGSEGRFAHGGATLQEVTIPVVTISKRRVDDVSKVEIDLVVSNHTITTGQIGVVFYQKLPVTEKIQPRILRATLVTEDNKPISRTIEMMFDSPSDNPADREKREQFMISPTVKLTNGQKVYLKLEEKITGTNQYTEYKRAEFINRRMFAELDF